MTTVKNRNRKFILCICLIMAITTHAQSKADSLKAVFTRLSKAIQTSDENLIKDDLHKHFSVSVMSWPASGKYLNRILESKKIESVNFVSVQSANNDTTFVNAIFNTTDNKKVESIVAFDSDNKLLFADYLDRFFSPSRYGKSKAKAVIPFLLKNESIVLPIRLNGSSRILYFLFDSGTDGMAISKSMADTLGLTISRNQNASVVGGTMQVSISSGNTVHLTDSLSLKNQSMAIFEDIGKDLDGIIGLTLAREYILNANFDTQQLSLFTFGDYQFEELGEIITLTVPHGVIEIPGLINIVGKKEVTGNFIFDTGAHYHLIAFEQFVRRNRLLLSGFKSEEEATTVSMGLSSPVFKGKTALFQLGENIKLHNMPITLQASTGRTNLGENMPDGSIGIELLSQFNFTIDLLRKIVHLSPNSKMKE